MPVKSRSPFVVYLRQNKPDIFTHQVETFNTDTDLPTVRFPYTLDLPETPDFSGTSDLSSSLNICPTVVENSTMKLKVKRTARKTITKIVPKPLIIELTANREEEKAGSGANSYFSENVGESSPSEKAKDVNDSSSISGGNFSWKKESVMYKEGTYDSGQSDSEKPCFLRSGPTVKDDAITASSGSLFSKGDDFELNKETMVQAEEPHVESSASNASGVSTPHKVTSDNLSSKSDDFDLSKEITVQAEEPHVESPASNASGISITHKITSDSLEVENLPPTDFGLQKKDDSRKSVAGKEGKGTTTSIQEVLEGDKQGRGRPPKVTLKSSDLEIPSSSDSQLQKRDNLRKLIESKEEKRASIQEIPKVSKRGRGRPPKVTSKDSEPETSSLSDSGLRKKDNLRKSVGSREGKNTLIQRVPESCKRGRGRPRKQSSVDDYSNKTIKGTVVDEILPSSESENFAPLEKNVSIVLKRLTNAELKKYNVEDQLKIRLNQGMIGKKININDVSHDRNLSTVTYPTEESELSVVSDTEIQNANLKKENLKENVEKWLQTVVIVHCVDNLEENLSDQSVVKDASTINQSVESPERRRTPKELNNRKRKIIPEPTLNNLSPSKTVAPNKENSVDLVSKSSDSEIELVPIEQHGHKNTLTPIVCDQETASRSSSISSSLKKKKSRNFSKESIENSENDEDLVSKKSDPTKKLECIEQHGRKRRILPADPVTERQNSVISSVEKSTSKRSTHKRLCPKPVENNSDKDLESCIGTIVKSITSRRDKKTSTKNNSSSSKKDNPKRRGRKGKIPLSATSSVRNMPGRNSRASSRVIPPALSEDMKKLYCNVEMPDTTHTNITVGTLFDMYDMSPVIRINRIEPDYLEYLLSAL